MVPSREQTEIRTRGLANVPFRSSELLCPFFQGLGVGGAFSPSGSGVLRDREQAAGELNHVIGSRDLRAAHRFFV